MLSAQVAFVAVGDGGAVHLRVDTRVNHGYLVACLVSLRALLNQLSIDLIIEAQIEAINRQCLTVFRGKVQMLPRTLSSCVERIQRSN